MELPSCSKGLRDRIFVHWKCKSHFKAKLNFFDAHRVLVKRERGVYGKTIVFGLVKCQRKVYTKIVPDCSKSTFQDVIRDNTSLDSAMGWLENFEGLCEKVQKCLLRRKMHERVF